MRASYHVGKDTLNPDRVPAEATELDHRPRYIEPHFEINATLVAQFIGTLIIALGAVLGCRLLGPFLSSWLMLAIFLVVGVFAGIMSAIQARPLIESLFSFLTWPISWAVLLVVTVTSPTKLTLFVGLSVALAGIAVLSDMMANQYLHCTLASPLIGGDDRKRLSNEWNHRLKINAYLQGFGWLAGLWFLGLGIVFFISRISGSNNTAAWSGMLLIAFAIACGLCCLARHWQFGRNVKKISYGEAWWVLWQIIINWIGTPVAPGSQIPGILRDANWGGKWGKRFFDEENGWAPFNIPLDPLVEEDLDLLIEEFDALPRQKTFVTRIGFFQLVLIATAFATLPAAYYFPVSMAFNREAWTEATASIDNIIDPVAKLSKAYTESEGSFVELLDPKNLDRASGIPSIDDLREGLSEETQEVLREFSDEEVSQYLVELQEQYVQASATKSFDKIINSMPESWLLVTASGLFSRNASYFVWTILIAFVFCLLVPAAVFLSGIYLVAAVPATGFFVSCRHARAEKIRKQQKEQEEDESGLAAESVDWDEYINRIQGSGNAIEREHLLLGFHSETDVPVLAPRTLFHEHAHILGDSGSGKTSRALSPLVTQLIRMKHSSVFIIDMKGDDALFHNARIEAEKAGLECKWFGFEPGRSSFMFNPFLQRHCLEGMTRDAQAELLMQALELDHGEGLGASYFASAIRTVLSTMLTNYEEITSFRELLRIIELGNTQLGIPSREWENSGHLFSVLRSLSRLDALNGNDVNGTPKQVQEAAIHLHDVVTTPQVIIFSLPIQAGGKLAKYYGKLALLSLLGAARHAQRVNEKTNQVYLIVDEFQEIISKDLEVVFRQARSSNIGAIFANQAMDDLKQGQLDMRAAVRTNTRVRIYFSASDISQQDDLIKESGDTVDIENDRDTVRPRINRNEIIAISDDPDLALVRITRGEGYAQYGGHLFPMRTQFHISKGEHNKRSKGLAWPEIEGQTLRKTTGSSENESTTTLADEDTDVVIETVAEEVEEEPVVSNQDRFNAIMAEQERKK